MVAHLHGMQGVRGSNPLRSTQKNVMRIAGIVDVGDCCFAKAQVSTAFVSPLR